MSSHLSPKSEPSKPWWPRASKAHNGSDAKNASNADKPPAKLSLNSFASAFGLKSKKQSAMAIQDPPPSLIGPASITQDVISPTAKYVNRPSSKSLSSAQSPVDSIEPRTPRDGHPLARQSLLTLSDHDPFAGRGITLVHSPHPAVESNRLSIYSNNSLPEMVIKKSDNRHLPNSPAFSYPRQQFSSPSSASHLARPATIQGDYPRSRRTLPNRKSSGSLSKRPSVPTLASYNRVTNTLDDTLAKSGSSSTLTDRSQPTVLGIPNRPPMRARGMTESGPSHYTGSFLGPDSAIQTYGVQTSGASWATRNLSRPSSISRLGLPFSSPPSHELPPPPPLPPLSPLSPTPDDASGDEDAIIPGDSASSSSLSFASSVSLTRDVSPFVSYSSKKRKNAPSNNIHSTNNLDSEGNPNSLQKTRVSMTMPSPMLKKAVSHHSLARLDTFHNPHSLDLSQSQMEEEVDDGERSPRNQRSFHHARLPPLSSLNWQVSTTPLPSGPSGSQSPVIEQRRGSSSGSSLPSRRRLFSGSSRRPSTSQGTTVEDDALSILSLRSEQNILSSSSSRPWTRPSSCSPSAFGEENAGTDQPGSPHLATAYTPQYIMSPAKMAQVEASVEAFASSPRSRGLSVSTVTSIKDDELATSPTLPLASPFSSSGKDSAFPSRNSSLLFKSLSPPPRVSLRPSTSQAEVISSKNEQSNPGRSLSPSSSIISLPPPPRPRPRTTTASSVTLAATQYDIGGQALLQTPPRRSLVPKSSLDRSLRYHSIIRKPSFLEIDDVQPKREPVDSPDDSFLDLTRESFDIEHSID
ncbi:hypothetical protein AX17_000811 [Amanita inopinata Kibby_2008]|nr:hypothetical protein AX17_000811 [Amanita inopinata Kibby_2008]